MEKKTYFEVVPLGEVLRKVRSDEGFRSGGDDPGTPPLRLGRLIEDAPFQVQKERTEVRVRRVFVVDDERIIADSLSAILKKCQFDAKAFYDAETALSACEIANPECLISDVAMPGMNGIDLAKRMKQRFPTCRILLFSGHAATVDLLADAMSSGYDFELLAKPVHPRDLLARLGVSNPYTAGNLEPARV